MNQEEFNDKYNKILEKFKVLKVESEEDVQFDRASLEKHFNSTIKISKWINKKSDWNALYRSYEIKRAKMWKKTYEYYKTDYQLTIGTKEEYQMLINSDPQYSNLNELCKLVKEVVDYIDEVVKCLRDRQWEMKNFVDYLKFMHGQ